jgi:hypothetical protein
MTSTWRDILESKKFWFAILTLVSFAGSCFGFHLDVTVSLALATPFGLLLGALGWADSGPGGAVATQAKLLRRAQRLPDGVHKSSLLKLLGTAVLILMLSSCSLFNTASKAGYDCVKEEAAVVQKGSSLIAIGIKVGAAVIAAVSGDDAPLAALVLQWGEPLCACISRDLSKLPATVGLTLIPEQAKVQSAASQVIGTHAWKYASP